MKKQIKKLSLSKRTISNLNFSEMNRFIGGGTGTYQHSWCRCGGETKNGNTCPGHNTCYNC